MKNIYGLLFSFIIIYSATSTGHAQPTFVWAGKMGGQSISSAPSDAGRSIALDKNGNVYTTGDFWGVADFNPGPGINTLTSGGASDVFVSKLSNDGKYIWAKQFSGSNYNDGNDIAVDAKGYIYIVGTFQSPTDFDPGPGVHTLTPLGYRDVFVCKLDSNGSLVWVKQFGGEVAVTDQVDGTGIAVDGDGNVYTTGSIWYGKADFDPGPGVYNLATAGDLDVFVSKLNSNGDFEWAKRMGGTKRDAGNKIAVDGNGYVYLTGYFTGTVDFDPGPNVVNLSTSQFYKDIFICRFDSTGVLSWAHQIGVTNGDDEGEDISVDAVGNIYATGKLYYGGADFDPGPGVYTLSANSSSDIFICKWDSSANFQWADGIGASSMVVNAYSIAQAGSSVCITGNFGGRAGWAVDFDPGPGVYNLYCNPGTSSNSVNIFVEQLDTAGKFVCAGWMGGPTGIVTNTGFGIAADNYGNMYTTGQFVATADFDPDSIKSYYLTTTNALDDEDIFVCKLHGPSAIPVLPSAAFQSNDTSFCTSTCTDFINLSSNATSWLWSFPGAVPLADTSQVPKKICYNTPGDYDVTLIAYNAFGSDTAKRIKYINYHQADIPFVMIPGSDKAFCSGDSIRLCSSGSYSSYKWNTGDTSYCTYAKADGGYWVSTTDSNGCKAQSVHRLISAYAVPSVSISLNGDTLSSSGAVSYQWYLDGDSIPGADSRVNVAGQTGYYSVVIVDSNGCSAKSNDVYFLITGTDDDKGETVNIYPNPFSMNNVQLTVVNDLIGSNIEVYDADGRIVFNSKLKTQNSKLQLEIERGVYLLRISGSSMQVVRKLIKL